MRWFFAADQFRPYLYRCITDALRKEGDREFQRKRIVLIKVDRVQERVTEYPRSVGS